MSRSRDIAGFLGKTEFDNTANNPLLNTASDVGLDSAQVTVIAEGAGLTVYATKENMPGLGLTSGDQAYVTDTSRFYISNGSGWYNVALINATPSLTIDPTGDIILSKEGAATVFTLTGADSDNAIAGLTYSMDSDGNFGGLATLSQDSSVFTITPLSVDSATTSSSTVTFKASDGINFGTGGRTLTLSFSIENSASTVMLVKADTTNTDNQVDASTVGRTITEYADVTSAAYTPYHPGGYSTYFDGTGDYLGIPDDNGFELDGDFTIESWFYRTSVVAGTYSSIIGGNGSNTNGWTIYITNSNGAISFFHGSFLLTYVEGVQNNTWYHVAVARSGTSLKLFVNGIERQAITNSSTFNQNDGNLGTRIGYDISANGYFNGYIRDVRVVKGTAVYTSAFTPPTVPLTAITNTSLLTCHLPYIADKSTNNHVITVAGNTSTTRFSPYDFDVYDRTSNGGSIYFDGTGDYIDTPAVTDLRHDQGDWTMEFWYYPIAAGAVTTLNCMGQYLSALNFVCFINTNGSLGYEAGSGAWSAAAAYNGTAGAITAKKWHHIVYTRHNGNLRAYVNGVVNISADSATFGVNANLSHIIGSNFNVNYYAYGYISDYRFVQGTAVYTAAFTPPTEPLTAITNTKYLTSTNKNDIWDNNKGNSLTKFGNTTSSNAQRKFATSSAVYFDGTGDGLATPSYDDSLYNLGTADWTVEGWFYKNGGSTDQTIWSFSRSGLTAGTNVGHFYLNASGTFYYVNGANQIQGAVLAETTWTHIAITRSGNDHKLFINGVQSGSTWTNAITYSQGRPVIGTYYSSLNTLSGASTFSGYVQDFRITVGRAIYTTTFTPPTAEFE